jgi:hypothetical protein
MLLGIFAVQSPPCQRWRHCTNSSLHKQKYFNAARSGRKVCSMLTIASMSFKEASNFNIYGSYFVDIANGQNNTMDHSVHNDVGSNQNNYYGNGTQSEGKSYAETKSISDNSQRIHEWLSPPDHPFRKYTESLRRRSPRTGSWFIDGPQFSAWKTDPASLLWLQGGSVSL